MVIKKTMVIFASGTLIVPTDPAGSGINTKRYDDIQIFNCNRPRYRIGQFQRGLGLRRGQKDGTRNPHNGQGQKGRPTCISRRIALPFNLRPRPGGFPDNIMKFKIDENLNRVSAAMAAPVANETVAVELCKWFIDSGMFEDTPDNYGVTVIQATGDKLVSDMCAGLSTFLFGECRAIHCDVFDAFCRLVIIGDGDCPECGGELQFIETEGHELKDGDYYTPNSYEIDYYIYHCAVCGETIKSEKEL